MPLVFFHLPQTSFDRCFAAQDLAMLEDHFELRLPCGSEPSDLLPRWDQHISRARAVVTGWGTPPISSAMLDRATRLEILIHSAGSVRGILPGDCWERGLRVATCNAPLGRGVAETTLGLIIAALKGFFPLARAMRQPKEVWQEIVWTDPALQVRELFRVTIGVIGAGRAGRCLIELLRHFEVDLLLHDPTLSESEIRRLGCQPAPLDALFERSDVVTLHAPALPHLAGMIHARHFSRMKPGAIFINTARGMLVDEPALVAALETGRISAILDVTDPEPPSADSPFRRLPNVTLLPHISGAVSNGALRQGLLTVRQLLQWKQGQRMAGEISPELFAKMA